MKSIRTRLLVSLLSVVVLSAAVGAAITYFNVLRETESLFDYQLRQMALSLRDQGFIPPEEAAALANDSRYGLAAGIWTKDIQRVFRLTKKLRVGTVWVNAYRTLNFAMPFGGVKASGFGRENGSEGLHEYLRDKAVWIETTGNTRDPFVLG